MLFSLFGRKTRTENSRNASSIFEPLEGRTLFSAPASPHNLVATAASSSSISMKWDDLSVRETGYIVQRGTDNKTFTQINSLAANTASYTDSGRTAGTKYYYRVCAFNADGNSNFTNTASATTTASSTPAPSPTPTPTPVAIPSTSGSHPWANGGTGAYATGKWAFDGVSVNMNEATPSQIIPVLKALHIGSVRLWWYMANSWGNRGGDSAIAKAAQYKAAGFKVMMNVGIPTVPTYSEAAGFFSYVAHKASALAAVDLWEIGNEPNQKVMWAGTAQQYVTNCLKPAWDQLHAVGAKVVGAGPTWDVNYAKTLVKYGYLKYCDYANFHPYGPSPNDAIFALGAKAAYLGKPVIFSEWNVRNNANDTDWAKRIDAARKLIAPIAEIAFYFPFKVTTTMAGPGGLVYSNMSAHQPLYDVFKKWGSSASQTT